jgi:hypothetical protein
MMSGAGWLEPDLADIGSIQELAPAIITLTYLDPQRRYEARVQNAEEWVMSKVGLNVFSCG